MDHVLGARASVSYKNELLKKVSIFFEKKFSLAHLYKWDIWGAQVAPKWPSNYARSYGVVLFLLFSPQKCVLIALKRCPYYAGIWGAQVASLGGPALRHFRCLRQRASSVGVRMFFLTKKLYFLKEYVVSRFSKDMHSQLGSGWCRRALRDAPRWRQKRQKGSKISLAPHGGQAKNVKRYV